MSSQGHVSFVSSGPGDPELLTLRAVKRLQSCDVVLYDDLASGPVLDQAGPQTERIAVGKRAGRPSARQESVNALLVEHARAGKHVVRLKSGDSGLFGRLEEELTALHDAAIPYEIVPGVPSAMAAG
jgi:uroporphyrin-III C-methyltransferase